TRLGFPAKKPLRSVRARRRPATVARLSVPVRGSARAASPIHSMAPTPVPARRETLIPPWVLPPARTWLEPPTRQAALAAALWGNGGTMSPLAASRAATGRAATTQRPVPGREALETAAPIRRVVPTPAAT